MPDYKQMYFSLFNSVSDAIEILQKAQQTGECAYIGEACDTLVQTCGAQHEKD